MSIAEKTVTNKWLWFFMFIGAVITLIWGVMALI